MFDLTLNPYQAYSDTFKRFDCGQDHALAIHTSLSTSQLRAFTP